MTDEELREYAQARVDAVRGALNVPNHGTGFRCRVRLDRGGKGFWIRVHGWVDPEEFRSLLEQTLGPKWTVWLNGSKRYCRMTREAEP